MADPVGAPPRFRTKAELIAIFEAWKLEFQDGGKLSDDIPDVEGFCDYIDSYRDLFSEYAKKDEFSDAIKRIKNWIYYKKKQLSMKGKMPPAIFIFDAINNAGYSNKTETDITTGGEKLESGFLEAVEKIYGRNSPDDTAGF